MKRIHLLAAEVYGYSFAHYEDRLKIGNIRFTKLMPRSMADLERAEKEGWDDQRLAAALEVELADVGAWRKRVRDAVEMVDAATPADSFRIAVRQSLMLEFAAMGVEAAQIEKAVTQICFRAADLGFLLDRSEELLSDYSEELRRE